MQSEYTKQIDDLIDGQVRAILPLLETEVCGMPMLQHMSDLLFS
jgi:anion-transporting  ArsA/GET3 family ATPase